MSVPKLSSYLTRLNFSDKPDKIVKTLLADLKQNLKQSIEFFEVNYANATDSYDDSLVDFERKCELILSQGYEYFFKINSGLDILHILDLSQTNKYKYEECFAFSFNLSSFINSIHDLYYDKHELNINKALGLAKVNNNEEIKELYVSSTELKRELMLKEKINILNNYINQYVLQIYKISIVVQKIELTSDMY